MGLAHDPSTPLGRDAIGNETVDVIAKAAALRHPQCDLVSLWSLHADIYQALATVKLGIALSHCWPATGRAAAWQSAVDAAPTKQGKDAERVPEATAEFAQLLIIKGQRIANCKN